MSDAAWRGLGALGVLFFGYLLWAFEPVLWQQALLALLALDSLLLALLGALHRLVPGAVRRRDGRLTLDAAYEIC